MPDPEFDDFRAEDDLRTLQRAEEIKQNPDRIAKAKNMADKKMKELKKVKGQNSEAAMNQTMKDGFRKL